MTEQSVFEKVLWSECSEKPTSRLYSHCQYVCWVWWRICFLQRQRRHLLILLCFMLEKLLPCIGKILPRLHFYTGNNWSITVYHYIEILTRIEVVHTNTITPGLIGWQSLARPPIWFFDMILIHIFLYRLHGLLMILSAKYVYELTVIVVTEKSYAFDILLFFHFDRRFTY